MSFVPFLHFLLDAMHLTRLLVRMIVMALFMSMFGQSADRHPIFQSADLIHV
jgi:hypothetical protein